MPAKVVVVIVDGLPVGLADEVVPDLPFLGPRLPLPGAVLRCTGEKGPTGPRRWKTRPATVVWRQ
jgi:hypothetical protein